jgi:glucokinase
VASREIPTRAAEGPAAWLERLAASWEALKAEPSAKEFKAAGAGLASPGALDREKGEVIVSPNLPAWVGFPLVDQLSQALGVPVVLENDANCYVWGEFVFGAGKNAGSMAGLTLGTGVGGGLVIDGELVIGPSGSGGELGHMIVDPAGRMCPCGARGCLEAHASATALTGMLEEALAWDEDTVLAPESSAKEMAQAARAGDEFALEVFASAGVALGRAAASLTAALGIDLIVLGGKLAKAWDLMEDVARAELKLRLKISDPARVIMTPASLGGEAPMLGAADITRHRLHS